MRFEPQPNDSLQIGKDIFKVMPHPAVPTIPFGQEGGKGIVYQLKWTPDGMLYALKVFRHAFQGPYVVKVAQRIARYATLPGMAACERTVLTRDKHRSLITQYPELEYAVLMPWVAGRTWHDIMYGRHPLSCEQSLELAKSIADILSKLEEKGMAHCDIADGNVLISVNDQRVSLVDLEDVYDPELPPQSEFPAGSAGYQHKTSRTNPQGQWCAEGDRFSGAILLAEILAWHDPKIRQEADVEHYFAEDEMQDDTCERYKLMLEILGGVSRDIAELFDRAWLSPTLARCPTLSEWVDVIARAVEAQQPLRALEQAIDLDSDRQILRIWLQYKAVLATDSEAQKYRSRVDLAKYRCEALDRLQSALASGQAARVITIYFDHRSLLELCQDFLSDERKRVKQIVDLRDALQQAIQNGDDAEIERLYTAALLDWSGALTHKEGARVELAIRRMDAYKDLKATMQSDSDEQIVAICREHKRFFAGFQLVESDPRVLLAERRVDALQELRAVLRGRNNASIWEVYSQHYDLLEPCRDFSTDERALVEEVRRRFAPIKIETLKWALWIDDDLKIEEAYDPLLFRGSDALDHDEQFRAELASDRVAALRKLQSDLKSGDSAAVVQTYDDHADLLRYCSGFTAAERKGLIKARHALLRDKLEAILMRNGSESDIVSVAQEAIESGCDLDESTLEAVRTAKRRLAALRRLEKAITHGDDRDILFAYNADLLDSCREVTPDQKRRVRIAQGKIF